LRGSKRPLRTRVVRSRFRFGTSRFRRPWMCARSGLSQAAFAARYGFNRRTLQDWEQGRVTPDAAVQAYLRVIDRNPQAVVSALQG